MLSKCIFLLDSQLDVFVDFDPVHSSCQTLTGVWRSVNQTCLLCGKSLAESIGRMEEAWWRSLASKRA